MEIKLNKVLQKKLNFFLETKDDKLNEFLKILKLKEFVFTKEEINIIEQVYIKDNSLREYVYIYILEKLLYIYWVVFGL